ncbi:MAG TPA: GTPase HflX [Atribacteraceae bacterium]|nr:GTPase HflX [Atribacteraceae bacterium]
MISKKRITGQVLVIVIQESESSLVFREEAVECRETVEIARSSGLLVFDTVKIRVQKPTSRYYIGKGKVEEIQKLLSGKPEIASVVLSREISPSQQRNLETFWQKSVLTKNELIHAIFAARALTAEGKIKVELAGLKYQYSRLPGKGKDMSRTGAGIGTRGPGEQKIEANRREIKDRIVRLSRKLEKINQRRALNKATRLSGNIPLVAIVGYTNAGKSTLFNALTGARVFVQSRMFATLHPTVRKRFIPSCGEVLFADTVGFLRDMPTTLKDAFRATIEEIKDADLIIELIDITDPAYYLHYQVIDQTLCEIGASKVPRIIVFNKCDLTPDF